MFRKLSAYIFEMNCFLMCRSIVLRSPKISTFTKHYYSCLKLKTELASPTKSSIIFMMLRHISLTAVNSEKNNWGPGELKGRAKKNIFKSHEAWNSTIAQMVHWCFFTFLIFGVFYFFVLRHN